MSKESEFLIFAVEYYRNQKKLTGRQVAELFSKQLFINPSVWGNFRYTYLYYLNKTLVFEKLNLYSLLCNPINLREIDKKFRTN